MEKRQGYCSKWSKPVENPNRRRKKEITVLVSVVVVVCSVVVMVNTPSISKQFTVIAEVRKAVL